MITSKYNDVLKAISEKHSLPFTDVQKFTNSFFSVLNTALEKDKLVKVKGLGTFKVVEVQDRESINVNTGERMVISGHNKVAFTPDSVMRDRVNRPFLQFDTVILGDKIDMNEIDQVSEEETKRILDAITLDPFAGLHDHSVTIAQPTIDTIPSQTPVMNIVEEEDRPAEESSVAVNLQADDSNESVAPIINNVENVDDTKAEEVEIKEETVTAEPEPEAAEENDKQDVEEDSVEQATQPSIVEEPVTENPQDEVPEKEEESSPSVDPETDKPTTDTEEENSNTTENESDTEEEESEEDSDLDEEESNSHCKLYLAIAFVITAIVAFGIGFFAGEYYTENMKPQAKNSELKVEKPKKEVVVADTTSKDTLKKVKEEVKPQETPVAKDKVVQPEKKTPEKAAVEEKKVTTPADQPDYNSMDARVRTGAYAIVGLDRTVTAKAGETLLQISNRALGPGMECYVEVYNGIKEVKEGQTVKIPKIVLKKKLAKKI